MRDGAELPRPRSSCFEINWLNRAQRVTLSSQLAQFVHIAAEIWLMLSVQVIVIQLVSSVGCSFF